MTRGWAITLLVVVVLVFAGGSTLAALAFVSTINARPLTVTCTVDSTFGDIANTDGADGGSKPGYSVQTSGTGEGASACEDFYVRDVALRSKILVGETYRFTIANLIGYTNIESAALVSK